MTGQEIKNLCLEKDITFIPHHDCAICGEYTGWYLFGRWPPYEVAYSGACGCCDGGNANRDTWESIADWVNGPDGQLKDFYKQIFCIND